MLADFQFPIADARSFAGDPDLRLAVPDWPNPTTDIRPQFIHYFGRAVERRLQADEAWPDEMKFCRVRRAIRFPNLAVSRPGSALKHMHPQCAFRRLFCDGVAVVRVEVGVRHHSERLPLSGLDDHDVLSIAMDLCDMPSDVPTVGSVLARDKLVRQGPRLAQLYARGTLATISAAKAGRAEGLVEAGNPLILIELLPEEAAFPLVPKGFVQVPVVGTKGASLAFGRVSTRRRRRNLDPATGHGLRARPAQPSTLPHETTRRTRGVGSGLEADQSQAPTQPTGR